MTDTAISIGTDLTDIDSRPDTVGDASECIGETDTSVDDGDIIATTAIRITTLLIERNRSGLTIHACYDCSGSIIRRSARSSGDCRTLTIETTSTTEIGCDTAIGTITCPSIRSTIDGDSSRDTQETEVRRCLCLRSSIGGTETIGDGICRA